MPLLTLISHPVSRSVSQSARLPEPGIGREGPVPHPVKAGREGGRVLKPGRCSGGLQIMHGGPKIEACRPSDGGDVGRETARLERE